MRNDTSGNHPGRATPPLRESLRASSLRARLPRVAFFSLSGCGGCVEGLLGRDDILTLLATRARIGHMPQFSTASHRGAYDLAVIEGGVARAADVEVLKSAREASTVLVALGTCAAAGGICSLSMQSAAEVVKIDHVLGGCPVAPHSALALFRTLLDHREPLPLEQDVCDECRQRGLPCVAPCLGPFTRAGCGALCPSLGRGCMQCAGPSLGAANSGRLQAAGLAGVFVNAWAGTASCEHPGSGDPVETRFSDPAPGRHGDT